MVDKGMSLTFSVRNNPGRFALLLGSGVSTEAGIPTGWAVVTDLIKKVAEAEGKSPDPTPETWYKEKYGEEPAYDTLIEKIAPSKEERQSLLEDYFEPTQEEKESGEKTPTDAHESIAWLIDNNYIDVVITTNFDRLLEQALSDRGITPVVISGREEAKGAEPLAHQDAVILKVNGDYKETNIKNVASELEEYSPEIQALIDEVFENYGLIVCGWSGKWDTALRKSLKECEIHRYSTYWAYHGSLEDEAESLVTHRDGFPIQIDGARAFFSNLKERVQALEGAESGSPLTREVARERVKRYMMREEHRIDLADLLREETERVYDRIFDESRYPLDTDFDKESVVERPKNYEAEIKTLAVACSTCAYWSSEAVNPAVDDLEKVIRKVGSPPRPRNSCTYTCKYLRKYPATYLVYSIGVAAVESGNWNLVHRLLVDIDLPSGQTNGRSVALNLHPARVGAELPGWKPYKIKVILRENVKDCVTELIPNGNQYQRSLNRFDIVMDMEAQNRIQTPDSGEWRPKGLYNQQEVEELEEELESQGENLEMLQAGLFNGSVERMGELLDLTRPSLR